MKQIALITVHGMGEIDNTYYKELEKNLKNSLGNEWEKISFNPVNYAHVFQKSQESLWQKMLAEPKNDLDLTKFRKFFLYSFSDAASLEHSIHRDKTLYFKVQKEIENTLELAYQELINLPNKPVILVAHSLGCQVISNYLWDTQKKLNLFSNRANIDPDKEDFLRLKTCENLVTTGCNIPIFTAGLKDRKCFDKPNHLFKWENFYDPDDILGWPIKQLGDGYHEMVEDHSINAGGFFTSWNIFSHQNYWGDDDIANSLTKTIKSKIKKIGLNEVS